MKKMIIIFSALILLFSITGCKKQEDIYNIKDDIGLSEEIQKKIIEADIKGTTKETKDVVIEKYFGEVDGYYVLFIGYMGRSYAQAEKTEEVAGFTFIYPVIRTLQIYHDDEVYDIKEGYESGKLSKEMVEKIFECYYADQK